MYRPQPDDIVIPVPIHLRPQANDIRTEPNGTLRLIAIIIVTSSYVTPLWLGPIALFIPNDDIRLQFFFIALAVEPILLSISLASLFIIPPRDEEQWMVERLKKGNLLAFMGWCFMCALYPNSYEVHLAEMIIGCMFPIVGCWVIVRVPHLFATRFPDGWEEEAKHFV